MEGYVFMEIFNALVNNMKRNDTRPLERLEYSKVRSTIENYCQEYLKNSGDIFKFALPNALDATIAVLESKRFLEKYEFNQISETCFIVRLRELDLI